MKQRLLALGLTLGVVAAQLPAAALATELVPVVVNGSYSYHIQGDDWGSGVDKVVLSLDKAVSNVSADDFAVTETKETELWYGYPNDTSAPTSSPRTVLDAYPCDAEGSPVEGESQYVALELYISPDEGSPIVFHASMYNTWCDPYYLTIDLAEDADLAVGGETVEELAIVNEATGVTSSADVFETDVYEAADGTVYNYATYTPAVDTDTLVVWLHGMGEGGVARYGDRTNVDVTLLAAEVTALAGEEFQSTMGGAHLLVPQCPTAWMDGGSGGIDGTATSIYTESLHELIAAYKAEIGAEKVIIAGCSNGGYMTMMMAIHYGDEYDAYVPICEAYKDELITDKQIAALAELPLFFIYSQDDTTVDPTLYEIPTLERLKDAGAENLCIFAPEHVYDTTGRFGEDYTYMGHWSWTYFFNNTAVCEDCGASVWQWMSDQVNVTVNGSYSYHIQGDDWGAGVDKVVLSLDKAVSNVSADDFVVTETKETELWYGYPNDTSAPTSSVRTILKAYPCDAEGNAVEGESQYVALELYISPDEGSPIVFHASFYNTWCDPYYLTITLAEGADLAAAEGTVTMLNISTEATDVASSADAFETDVYEAEDGTVYNYATYTPAVDTDTLVVWLHGMGEGAVARYGERTDAYIPLLAAEVTALAGEEFQSIMGGAYILAPQCPTVWMDGGSGGIEGNITSIYTESLHELIAAYKAEIGAKKVIIAGCSNGGYMTMMMAINYGDEYDAYVPICEAYKDELITDEQIAELAQLPLFFIYAQDDTTVDPTLYEIPTLERLKEAGAENLCIFAPEHVYDTTGRFGEGYIYMGHWSWTYFFNNTAVCEDCGLDVWSWMAKQVEEAPAEPAQPTTPSEEGDKKPSSPQTGDTTSAALWMMLAAAAVCGVAVCTRRKHS